MATINDVAKLAGVSNATASRALRNIGKTKKSTILKVQKAAKELGYVVNITAQTLKNHCKDKVGFIVSDINNDYYHQIQSIIQDKLHSINYELSISFSSENPTDERKSFKTLIGMGVNFIFFTPTCSTNKDLIEIAYKNNIQVIQLFRKIYDDVPCIINNDEKGTYLAAKQLFNLNCKNLLLLDVNYEHILYKDVSPSRKKGFLQALNDFLINGNVIHINIVNHDSNEIIKAIEKYKPDGIIASNGDFGFDVLHYFVTNRIKNIKLISFDDNKWFELLNIQSIKQDNEKIADAIFSFIKEEKRFTNDLIIDESLVIR